MVTLPEAAWRDDPALRAVIDLLGGAATTRLVGGAVRDGLLTLPVSDVDVATRLTPSAVTERLRAGGIKVVPTGVAHGTVTAVTASGPIEVTTLRRDIATDGRHAIVEFADDWREDAARRDFTINALYADAVSGAVFDWFGGLGDLEARRVRFIGDPLTRIAEDHLRILRFFRFHARFGHGEPDADGLAACAARANDLMALSRERIAAELTKLLGVVDPVPAVATMIAAGILRPVLPEIVEVERLRTLVARERAFEVPGDALRRLAALIPPDPAIANAVATRLRLSNADTKRLVIDAARSSAAPQMLVYRYGRPAALDLALLGDYDLADIEIISSFEVPTLPIKGGQLIAHGLPPGPRVADALRAIEERWIEAGFPSGEAFEAIVATAVSPR